MSCQSVQPDRWSVSLSSASRRANPQRRPALPRTRKPHARRVLSHADQGSPGKPLHVSGHDPQKARTPERPWRASTGGSPDRSRKRQAVPPQRRSPPFDCAALRIGIPSRTQEQAGPAEPSENTREARHTAEMGSCRDRPQPLEGALRPPGGGWAAGERSRRRTRSVSAGNPAPRSRSRKPLIEADRTPESGRGTLLREPARGKAAEICTLPADSVNALRGESRRSSHLPLHRPDQAVDLQENRAERRSGRTRTAARPFRGSARSFTRVNI